jgi:hypothetical protein
MGSGHFLVDALDVLTGEIARHLSEHPLRPVRTVLAQLREMVLREAGYLPSEAVGELRDVDLLKRVVLKRCIYGVDRNRMAVELAKLGLWLEAFRARPSALLPRSRPQAGKQPDRRGR